MGLTGAAASVETALPIYTCSSPKSPNHQAQKLAYHTVWQPRFPAVIYSRNRSISAYPRASRPARGVQKHPEGLGQPLAQGDGDSPASCAESNGNHTGTVECKGD